jgi:hypothetical protein
MYTKSNFYRDHYISFIVYEYMRRRGDPAISVVQAKKERSGVTETDLRSSSLKRKERSH